MPTLSKEFIVTTYKVLVEANDGKLIAHKAFRRLTGISNRRWQGGYWRSWSEFQADCGFTPNTRPVKIPDHVLLQRYAELAMELKKLPSTTDFRIKRNEDRSFPNLMTFERLGRLETRLAKLAAFCEPKPEFAPVVVLLKRRKFRAGLGGKPLPKTICGVVYLTRQGGDFQIGRVRASRRRLLVESALLSQRPELVHMIKTDDPEGIERYWRARFRAKRQGRARFRLTDEDLGVFKRRRFQ
jgi:hypothetical protein